MLPSKKTVKVVFAGVLLFMSSFTDSVASHASAFELTYRHISGNTYEFTSTMYFNCLPGSSTFPANVQLRVSSASRTISNQMAATLTIVAPAAHQPPNLMNCMQPAFCYQIVVYRGTVNLGTISPLNPQANDWLFFSELCCWPLGTVTQPDNINYGSIYAECGLNNLDFPGNNSPFWHNINPNHPSHPNDTVINNAIVSTCEGKRITLDEHTVEYDGDSVSYEFIQPFDAGGALASYAAGFSFAMPMPFQTPPGFEIDSLTGMIDFVPGAPTPAPGVYIIGIKATEYRSVMPGNVAIEVGNVMRNLMVLVESASACADNTFDLTINNVALDCEDTSIRLTTSRFFRCPSVDSNASFVELRDVATSSLVPLHSAEPVSCLYDRMTKKVDIKLNGPLPAGDYFMTLVQGNDGNSLLSECGVDLATNADTIWIAVDSISIPEVMGSPDSLGGNHTYINEDCGKTELLITFNEQIRCSTIEPLGSDFLLIDSSGAVPIVNPIISQAVPVACKNGKTSQVKLMLGSSIQAGNYGLVIKQGADGNTLENSCQKEIPLTPTPSIAMVVDEVSTDLGKDLVYCKDSLFMAVLDAGPGFNTYNWNTGQTGQQIIVTTKGKYYVTVANPFGCAASDTVIVREIDCATGITVVENEQFEIYPNPSTGQFYIRYEGEGERFTVQVMDVNGKEVHNSLEKIIHGKDCLVDISAQPAGVYFIRILMQDQLLRNERMVIRK